MGGSPGSRPARDPGPGHHQVAREQQSLQPQVSCTQGVSPARSCLLVPPGELTGGWGQARKHRPRARSHAACPVGILRLSFRRDQDHCEGGDLGSRLSCWFDRGWVRVRVRVSVRVRRLPPPPAALARLSTPHLRCGHCWPTG